MRIKGFAVCDEHNGSLVTYDEKECPICEKIRDLEEAHADLVIDRDRFEDELNKAKASIAQLIIEKRQLQDVNVDLNQQLNMME